MTNNTLDQFERSPLTKYMITGLRSRPMEPVALLCFWVFYIAFQFPFPYVDDLFYLGPAISLFQGDGLRNPWLRGQFPGLDLFLVYPPFSAYGFSFWWKIFGLSYWSTIFFSGICGFTATLALARILVLAGVKQIPYMLASLIVFMSAAYLGHRPEIVGLPALLWGYLFWSRRKVVQSLGGAVLLILAPFIAPSLAVASLVGVAVVLYMKTYRGGRHVLIERMISLAVAFTFCAVLFLWSISWELDEFLRQFLMHAGRRTTGISLHAKAGFSIAAVLYLTTAVALVYRGRRPTSAGFATIAILTFILSPLAHARPMVLICIVWLVLLLAINETVNLLPEQRRDRFGKLALGSFLIVCLAINSVFAVHISNKWAAFGAGDIADSRLLSLRNTESVAIDPMLLGLFQYDPPKQFIDYHFSRPFPDATPHELKEIRAGETWLLSDPEFFALHHHRADNPVFEPNMLRERRAFAGVRIGLEDALSELVPVYSSVLFYEPVHLCVIDGEEFQQAKLQSNLAAWRRFCAVPPPS